MAKLDPRFVDIPNLGSAASEYGLWLEYSNARAVLVSPGAVNIGGVLFSTSAMTAVDIYDDFADAGSPVANTIYYLYAAVENKKLCFYFSSSAPVLSGLPTKVLEPHYRSIPLNHPTYSSWRYLGQVLLRSDATILPFTVCTPSYWEGAWNTISASNTKYTFGHAWGYTPREIDYFFSTSAANKDNLMRTALRDSTKSKVYGVAAGAVTDKSFTIQTAVNGTFWNSTTSAWVVSGYIKAIIRR